MNEMQQWIPVTERLPAEHESIYAKYYGTDKWRNDQMYMTESDDLLVTVRYEDGMRSVIRSCLKDGKWDLCGMVKDVIAWMPKPEPYQGDA